MWFASSGRSSAKRPQFAPWPRWRLDVGVVVGAPGLLAGPAREGRVDRPAGRREAPARAADEAALLVGLVELERLDEVAELALPAHQRLLEQAGDVGERDASSAASRRGRTSSPARRGALGLGREQQQPRRADRVGREDDDLGRLEVLAAVARRSRSRRSPGRVASVSMRRTRAPVTSRAPEGDRLRPVGQVGRRLGALVAARLARAPLDARSAAVVRRRVDRVELRPPVPAQLASGRARPSARPTRSGAAASARPRCRADRPDRRAGPTRRTRGRSGRSTAGARSSRSASRRRRRRASGPGSRTAGRAARRRRR